MGPAIRRAAIAFAAASVLAAPAAAAPGDQQFTIVENHDPAAFQRALRAGADFVKSGPGRQFRVILSGRGAIVGIPGTTTVQRDLPALRRGAAGLTVIACRETIDALSKANKRRVPVVSGITVQTCKGLRSKMTTTGWQSAPGL